MNTSVGELLELKQSDFNNIRKLVLEKTGISLSQAKMELVKRRFLPRLKALGLGSFDAYVDYVAENFDSEGTNFCNAITTNLTSFFRENHHYNFLVETALPALMARTRSGDRIRIWSAGCSTGQEAYCLAMTVLKAIPDVGKRDIRILATDLDENCIATGRKGSYPAREFENVDPELLQKYFIRGIEHSPKGRPIDVYTAKQSLKNLITFNKLNLMHEWPMKGQFDIIFCRNVFIYFDKDTQSGIVRRFSRLQKKDSWLCLGHSETIQNPMAIGYKLIGKTLYVRQ